MAKVTGPAFSVDAHGDLGGGICFTRCKSGHRVILSPQPGNPNSVSQSAHRTLFHSAKSAWKLLSPVSKAALNAEADLLHMTGYNLYIKRVLLGEISLPGWVEDSYEGQVAAALDDIDVWCQMSTGLWQINLAGPVVVGWVNDLDKWEGNGLRFLNVNIPKGATILTAHVHLTHYGDQSMTVKGKIIGNTDSNPEAFSAIADYQARRGTSCGGADNTRRTVAEVNWNFPASIGTDVEIESPGISDVIQELVDGAGYVSGRPMVLFVDDHDGQTAQWNAYGFWSYDDGPAKAAKLHITYKYLV